MTNEELIAKIKAEIERRMDKHWEGLPNADAPEDDWTHNELCELGAYKELEHLESFLSTLESEKSMNQDELEEEVDAYLDEHFDYNAEYDSIRLKGNFFPSPSTLLDIARHFAEWGADHRDSSEIPNDLEEAAKDYTDSSEWLIGENLEHIEASFIAGAKWDRNQMLEEAVEGEVMTNGFYPYEPRIVAPYPNCPYDFGDKVRVIVIPNTDEK